MFATRQAVTGAEEPIDLEEAKTQVRAIQDVDDEDDLIEQIIAAAREYCENITGRALKPCKIVAYPESTTERQRLPWIPVGAVEKMERRLETGEYQEMDAAEYEVDPAGGTLRVFAAGSETTGYRLTYQAGYASKDVPPLIRQAMLMLIGHWYQNRESVQIGAVASIEIELSTRNMLKQYKAWWY